MKVIKGFMVLLALCLLNSARGYAQQAELFGYFEPQLMTIKLNDNWDMLASNKLRVDVKSSFSKTITFGANFDFITYHGKRNWNILDYLPQSVVNTVPPQARPFFEFSYRDSIFLDNAFVKMHFKQWDLTLGKQQISLGTGYAWNPTDLFNVKNLVDPTYEQPGHNAVRADIPILNNGNVMLLFEPGKNLAKSAGMIRIKNTTGHFDYSLLAAQKYWRFSNYETFTFTPEKRRMVGADFAGELLGLGVWGEGAYNKMERSKDFTEWVLGLDYTWESGLYLMAEFYQNSMGKTDYKKYTLSDWMRLITAETKAICRDQAYLYLSYPATDLLTVSLSTILGLSDQSYALVPMLQYSLFENVDLTLIGQFYGGKEGTAYAKNLGNGAIFRVRVYF